MAAEIEEKTGRKVRVYAGRTSSLEVRYGDEVIFSKLGQNRFPKKGEVVSALQKVLNEKEKDK